MSKNEYWLDLERVAALILAEVNPDLVVTHNARVRGKLTEVDRQIDVLMEDHTRGSRIVVDCKDWKRPVTARDSGSFASLLEDVGATGGVMICNRGFSPAAANLARHKGFRLAALHDVASDRWRVDTAIPVVWRRFWISRARAMLRMYPMPSDRVLVGRLLADGGHLDAPTMVEDAWNRGELRTRGVSVILVPDLSYDEPNAAGVTREGQLLVAFDVASFVRLGHIRPRHARGLLDRETAAFHTAHLDVLATVREAPIDGWKDIGDEEEELAHLVGSALTVPEIVPARIDLTNLVPTESDRSSWGSFAGEQSLVEVDVRHLNDPDADDYRAGLSTLRREAGDPTGEASWIRRRIVETHTNITFEPNIER